MKLFHKLKLCIVDQHDQIIFHKKITSLPLKEEVIIAESIKYYDDPEPCMIHRSAVMKKIYIEIQNFFYEELNKSKKQLIWTEIPLHLQNCIDLKEPIKYLHIHEER